LERLGVHEREIARFNGAAARLRGEFEREREVALADSASARGELMVVRDFSF
jgi:hypothetical protein